MRKFMVGVVSAITLTGIGSSVADAQYYFSGPVPQWAGPYIGIEGGYGWGGSHHTDPTPFDSGGFTTTGGLAGGTVGYNWQLAGPVVLGTEADMSWTNIGGSTAGFGGFGGPCGGAIPNCTTTLDALGTVRARLGYEVGRFMPYATGGLAFGDVSGSEGDVPANGPAGSGSSWRAGWTIGAGIEGALAPNWTAKAEYLYVDLGNQPTFTDTFASGATAAQNVSFRTNIIRFGINYKF
jgi:outer membrane immunogenic protein